MHLSETRHSQINNFLKKKKSWYNGGKTLRLAREKTRFFIPLVPLTSYDNSGKFKLKVSFSHLKINSEKNVRGTTGTNAKLSG